MATKYEIQHVWNHTSGAGYRRGTDWTDDGDGTFTIVPGSDLATDYNGGAGDTIKYSRTNYSDTAPTDDRTFLLDLSYSGLVKITNPNTAFGSGTAMPIDRASIEVNEHGEEMQTNFSFSGMASNATLQGLVVGDLVALRLGTKDENGTAIARYEWRGKIVSRDWTRDRNTGEPTYSWTVGDFGELIREADVTGIPREAQADITVIPGDTSESDDLPPETIKGGVRAYLLSDLIEAVKPANTTVSLNIPDRIIERLPQEGDGLELLQYALRAAEAEAHWEASNLVIQAHEGTDEAVSITLTDAHVLEVRTQRGTRRQGIDSVTIERPGGSTEILAPDRTKPPTNGGGGAYLPSENETEDERAEQAGGGLVLYRVTGNWSPPDSHINYEPGPIMFGFSDTRYNVAGYTGLQLSNTLLFFPGQISVVPPVDYTLSQVWGPTGYDWYFTIPPISEKVAQSNADQVWGFVVSRNGYYSSTGAITRDAQPIAGAIVTLVGLNTGIVLGPATTTSDGYYSIPTYGERDRWLPSVYVPGDDYLANKNDIYTDGHPYDDDPANDDTGPSNLVEVDDTWQLFDTPVGFTVTWRTGRETPDGPADGTSDLYESYKGKGVMSFGGSGDVVGNVADVSDLDIDSANVTTEVQGGLLAEKIIDRSEEEIDTYVVTKPFGGESTAVGRTVQLSIESNDGLNAKVRVMTRTIKVLGGFEVEESISTQADAAFTQLDRAFARRGRVETALTKLTAKNREVERILTDFISNVPTTEQLGF